ncbi:MAG: hypothetical protein IJQ07_00790 [Clostridia bacterium]|nr:hypothetical protein [Clostridia bacterium]
MRIFFLATIPLITAFIGYIISMKFAISHEFWEDFSFWHKKIKSEISFSQRSILEIFNNFEDLNKSELFLSVAKDYVKNQKTTTKLNFLRKEEKEFINKYFVSLGTMDRDSQLKYLESLETELNAFSLNADSKNKKYRPLYVKMGFLIGLVVFILAI